MMLLLVYYFTLLLILYMTSSAPERFRRSRFWGVTKQGSVDPTFFRKKEGNHLMIVQIYVDDIIFSSTNPSLTAEFRKLMETKFEMSSIGPINFFLGLNIR